MKIAAEFLALDCA